MFLSVWYQIAQHITYYSITDVKNIIKNDTQNYININNISITLTTTITAAILIMKLIIKVAIQIINMVIKIRRPTIITEITITTMIATT